MPRLILIALVLVCLAVAADSSAVRPSESTSEDFDRLLEWFAGEFNNHEQHAEEVYAQEEEGAAVEPHTHVHAVFAPIELPELGEHVFHVQQSDGHDQSRVFRQRLYVFTPSGRSKIAEMRIYRYPEGGDWFDVHKHPERLLDLPVDMLEDTGCVVIWREDGEAFTAASRGGRCEIDSPRFGKVFVRDRITLSTDGIWILDNIVDASGNLVMGREDEVPRKLRRCRFYDGWAALRADPPDTTADAKPAWRGYRSLTLHDQGQRVALVDEDGTPAGYEVSLAQVTYAGTGTAVLKLAVHEAGEKEARCYVWGEPDAERLGLNVKWLQTGFTFAPERRFAD